MTSRPEKKTPLLNHLRAVHSRWCTGTGTIVTATADFRALVWDAGAHCKHPGWGESRACLRSVCSDLHSHKEAKPWSMGVTMAVLTQALRDSGSCRPGAGAAGEGLVPAMSSNRGRLGAGAEATMQRGEAGVRHYCEAFRFAQAVLRAAKSRHCYCRGRGRGGRSQAHTQSLKTA